ncbi:MAG: DUF4434 domain-containing protein, partial [Verrucomicrobiales bacterium]|nr:DUF4434 domain-containing protein [Verrucomicrobiales bacterium]
LGMDTVVVQYVAYDRFYHYPSSIKGVKPSPDDVIMKILNAARKFKLKVFLGLQMEGGFWKGEFDLEKRVGLNTATMNELHQRYGGHSGLGGWYLPEEIDDQTPGRAYADDLLDYLGRLSERAKELSKHPVLISPFFSKDVDIQAYAQWWHETALPKINVDIVAMQDGVGTHRVSLESLRAVYSRLAPIFRRHDVKFWSNVEVFDQIAGWPVNEQAWAARPAQHQRVGKQCESTAPFVSKIIVFEYSQYMDPASSPQAAKLYDSFLKKMRQD